MTNREGDGEDGARRWTHRAKHAVMGGHGALFFCLGRASLPSRFVFLATPESGGSGRGGWRSPLPSTRRSCCCLRALSHRGRGATMTRDEERGIKPCRPSSPPTVIAGRPSPPRAPRRAREKFGAAAAREGGPRRGVGASSAAEAGSPPSPPRARAGASYQAVFTSARPSARGRCLVFRGKGGGARVLGRAG